MNEEVKENVEELKEEMVEEIDGELFEDEESEEITPEEHSTSMVVLNVGDLSRTNKSEKRVFTTLDLEKDKKRIFNLENNCDFKINDCKGQAIRVKDVMIKSFKKKLARPIIDEETGEVKEYEFKKICILIDDQGKSYVTASKLFTLQFANYLEMFGTESLKDGLDIKIIEKPVKYSSNKSLGFELI